MERDVIRQIAILFGVPVLVAVAFAIPLAQWRGSHQWLCAVIALGLTVPVGIGTLVVANLAAKASPYVQITVVFLGMFVRMAFGFVGALLVFFASGETFRTQPLVFFGWVLGVYLTTLTVEIALLGSKMMRSAAGGQQADRV